jgi:chromate transporter
MNVYLDLLWTFFKLGCVTFGGGYAMLPVIERELVRRKAWATMDEVMDYFAIGQITPGIIAVNVSTFIGYKKAGVLGGILTTLGVVLPSLVIISAIAGILTNFAEFPLVRHAFAGIRVAVGALILNAVITLLSGAVKNWKTLLICGAAFLLSAVWDASPVFIVLSAGLSGFLLFRPGKGGDAAP